MPAGTVLHVRLTSAVSSQTSHPGDPVAAVVIAPVATGSGVLPAGTLLRGTVAEVTAHSIDHQATLRFTFDRLELGGRVAPVATRLLRVDNAREDVDSTGTIRGPSTQADRVWGRAELLALAVLVPEVFAVDVAGSRLMEGIQVEISYRPGVELDVEVTRPFEVRGFGVRDVASAPALPASLRSWVATLPVRTEAGQPPRPADLINVVFVGSSQQFASAFVRAEWTTADALSLRADVTTFLAIAGREGYRQGPVSLQTLDGRPPDYVFQKQNNTFAKRHHVRIWRQGSWQGRPLWVGAGTHDVGVKLAVAERSFTHRVDRRLDLERDKIVDDLEFAGLPPAVYVDRPTAPRAMQNATQDAVVTDGRVAVIRMPDLD